VYVEQSARKVTGLRGDYGSLQMTRGLEPALDEKTDEVFESVRDVLDKYAEGEGF
jgi:iron uptake system EfeUOB component EfeO/EfeM